MRAMALMNSTYRARYMSHQVLSLPFLKSIVLF